MLPLIATAALALTLVWKYTREEPTRPSTMLTATCAASDLSLERFPLNGAAGRDWVINSYVDLDPSSPGITDYKNNQGDRARTYDGHQGIDIDIPSFREMDSGQAVIYSVTAGTVEQVIDDQPDRHTRCGGQWNLVRIAHCNGFHIIYGHIKRGSARVVVGQTVMVGTPLAIVGSSGCSTQPHLHLEVRDCAHRAVDPFLAAPKRRAGLWAHPPDYDVTSQVMDVMLRQAAAPTLEQIKDPAPDLATIADPSSFPFRFRFHSRSRTRANWLGVGMSLAVRGGDIIGVSLVTPERAAAGQTVSLTVGGSARLSHRYASVAFPVAAVPAIAGRLTVEVRINDELKATRTLRSDGVTPPP